MIDIHHHLLYGLDDGPPNLEASLAQAEAAIANGITHLVCTPHSNDRWPLHPEVNLERLAEIEKHVAGRLTLGLGCDFHLSYDNIEDEIAHPGKYTINGKRYLLVEFPDFGISPNIGETLYNFVASGIIPIITHPERNATIQNKLDMMIEWMRCGCLVQVTAGSLLGRFGRRAEAASRELLDRNWVHFLASDAHNLASRPPNLSEGHAILRRDYGKDSADRLCIYNPRAAFYGEPMPPQPEAIGIGEASEPKKLGIFSRMFSS